ncbi:MAG: methyltransferase domain-containing protein [Verrucomicrobia bacterium]|nr:methyltransferase domain-containing protein [Verrucomicrobiota bacterium]
MLGKIVEAFELLYLHVAVKVYEGLQQRRVRKLFYHDRKFQALDQALLQGPNPFRLKEAFPYGETPLCSLKQIADRCGLKPEDKMVDLGCGRGRGVFFLAHHYGCQVHGIDKMRDFIDQASRLKEQYSVENASFLCEDLRNYDFSQATFVFFYGTIFSEEFVRELTEKLKVLPEGAKIITVSYPLEGFELKDQFPVSFSWGTGEVYYHLVSK